MLEYPKMLYHDFFGQRIVTTQQEENVLMGRNEGWRETPTVQQQEQPRPAAELHRPVEPVRHTVPSRTR